MAEFEFSRFLEDVSADQPCGENMEYDPLLQEIEQNAEGIAERTVGDSILAGEEADWRSVRSKSLQALERTRDIQVAVFLCRALVHLDGLEGVSQGLQLIHGLLDRYWDCVYPQKDEDDEIPVLRMNTLAALSDRASLLEPIRNISLTDSKVMGHHSLRDIESAKNNQGDASDQSGSSQVDAAFQDTDLEVLQGYVSAVNTALMTTEAIAALTTERVGAVNAPDLSPLVSLFKELRSTLAEQVQQQGGEVEGGSEVVADGQSSSGTGGAIHAINNREDVARAIDTICSYFARSDPSSPIPFMLRRAQRLLHKDFKEILADLAPDGINQAENIFGTDD